MLAPTRPPFALGLVGTLVATASLTAAPVLPEDRDPASALEIVVSAADDVIAVGEKLRIHVEFRNTGREALTLPRPNFSPTSGGKMHPYTWSITRERAGENILSHFHPTTDQDFITIGPGKVVRIETIIPWPMKPFDMPEPGVYSLSLAFRFGAQDADFALPSPAPGQERILSKRLGESLVGERTSRPIQFEVIQRLPEEVRQPRSRLRVAREVVDFFDDLKRDLDAAERRGEVAEKLLKSQLDHRKKDLDAAGKRFEGAEKLLQIQKLGGAAPTEIRSTESQLASLRTELAYKQADTMALAERNLRQAEFEYLRARHVWDSERREKR
jgi:hypothetical protein